MLRDGHGRRENFPRHSATLAANLLAGITLGTYRYYRPRDTSLS
jgi:hypothetical protein